VTASFIPFICLERRAWRQLRPRILAGEFDVVFAHPTDEFWCFPVLRFLYARGTYTRRVRTATAAPLCGVSAQGRQSKARDLELKASVRFMPFCSIHLSKAEQSCPSSQTCGRDCGVIATTVCLSRNRGISRFCVPTTRAVRSVPSLSIRWADSHERL